MPGETSHAERVKPDEKARFVKAADEAGMDVSTFMRSATIEKIERRGQT